MSATSLLLLTKICLIVAVVGAFVALSQTQPDDGTEFVLSDAAPKGPDGEPCPPKYKWWWYNRRYRRPSSTSSTASTSTVTTTTVDPQPSQQPATISSSSSTITSAAPVRATSASTISPPTTGSTPKSQSSSIPSSTKISTTTTKPTTKMTTSTPTTTKPTPPTTTTTTTKASSTTSSTVAGGGSLTQASRDLILNLHNKYRSQLAQGKLMNSYNNKTLGSASDMYQMVYNTSIEQIAKQNSDKCVFAHSGSPNLGENIYTYSAFQDADSALSTAAELWWNEIKNGFDTTDSTTPPYPRLTDANWKRNIGHFTAMAWGSTVQLGCAVTKCEQTGSTMVFCNYSPPGNMIGAGMYTYGAPCGSCPNKCNQTAGLCLL